MTQIKQKSKHHKTIKMAQHNFQTIIQLKIKLKNELKCILNWTKPQTRSKHQINGQGIYPRSNKVKGP